MKLLSLLTTVGLSIVLFSCNKDNAPSPALSPDEALGTFVLADENLEIELVAAEPLVEDPVAITFDAAGRLWVVEMLGFMADIDGNNENDPVGRVSVLFDDDGDGRMDRGQIFLDSLVMPRAMALVKDGVLVAENKPLWYVQDTDGDFKADTKVLIDSTYGGSGMPEHSANGLWRGLDNWLYNAKSKFRYKNVDGQWIKDETEFRGQWGIAHDNVGRLFYNYNWSQLHGDLVPPNVLLRNTNHTPTSGIDHGLTLEREIYPIRSNPAVNRGYVPGTLDEQGRLLEFASACGPLIYRGDALPENYAGNAFVCEPTANLIKQNKITEEGFMLSAQAVYKDREFLASTDERFRPVSLAPGPDGALYVVDMYKGIIQHGPYMSDYLREVTLKRELDRPIHMGRIWRIKKKGNQRKKITDLTKADSKTLIGLLGSPDGWTRDTAQRLMVERGNVGTLDLGKLVETGNPLGQLHALWTLEGLGVKSPDVYLSALSAEDPRVDQAALRILGNLGFDTLHVKAEIEQYVGSNYDGASPLLQMQMVLSTNQLNSEITFEIAKKFLKRYGALPVARDVVMSSLQDREATMLSDLLENPDWKTYDQNREIFIEMLATSVANKGNELEISGMLDLASKKLPGAESWFQPALVNGILNSRGSNEAGEITFSARPKYLDRENVEEALKKKFTWPGKPKTAVAESERAYEIDRELFAVGRQNYLNLCASCHGTQGEGMKRFAPPLKNSQWVTGEEHRLIMILLYGMEGPVTVNEKTYDIPDILPSMPSFTTLQDQDISAIATYIRNSWGNAAEPIKTGTVGHIRFRTQGQITPWTASELDTLVFDIDLSR